MSVSSMASPRLSSPCNRRILGVYKKLIFAPKWQKIRDGHRPDIRTVKGLLCRTVQIRMVRW